MNKVNSLSREWKQIKELPFKKKLGFIWDYYKWHILITAFVVISVIATAIALANEKEIVLSGYLFDSLYTTEQEEPFVDFPEYAKLNHETETADFFTNLTLYGMYAETSQQFYSTSAAGHTDFAAAGPQTFLRLSYDSFKYFYDLREILTADQLAELSGRLFYVDASMLDQLDGEGTIQLPDHDKPEAMKDPVPIGINIRGGRGVDELYLGEDPVFLAVLNNAPHLDMTLQFLEYLDSNNE